MSDQIGLVDLLRQCGFDPARRSKLVRHQDKRHDLHDLLRRGWLDAYQGFQVRPIFDGLARSRTSRSSPWVELSATWR